MGLANRGMGLERIILGANNYYGIAGVAEVVKMPTPVRVKTVTKTGEVKGYFEKSTVDFYGTLKGGRSIYFDAKETKEPRFDIANESKLGQNQVNFLNKQHALGALCFLVIDFTRQGEAYLVPWPVAVEYYNRGINLPPRARGKSLPILDCQERPDIYRIDTTKGYLHYLESVLTGAAT